MIEAVAGVALRPVTRGDDQFLAELYASTREEELRAVPWTSIQKAAFLESQHRAQHRHYTENFPDADRLLIVKDDQAIGRLYLDRRRDEHRLIDIALVPAYRRQGIGTSLIKRVLTEAAGEGLPVRIHVEHFNPALRLYRRLGFVPLEDRGVYVFMEWMAEG